MCTPMETIHDFMATFIAAWPERDASKLGACFSEDAVYHNGPMEPIKGREAILATLAGFMAVGGQVGVDILHIVADGPIVMTERVDNFIGTENSASLPMMGIFEVHGGKITAWRDYFDPSHFTSQMSDQA